MNAPGEAQAITAALAGSLGWNNGQFPAVCRDVAALMNARAHLENIGAAEMWDTATHCLAALGTVLLASEGDPAALERLAPENRI